MLSREQRYHEDRKMHKRTRSSCPAVTQKDLKRFLAKRSLPYTCLLGNLPDVLVIETWANYLSVFDLCRISRVNAKWHRVIDHNTRLLTSIDLLRESSMRRNISHTDLLNLIIRSGSRLLDFRLIQNREAPYVVQRKNYCHLRDWQQKVKRELGEEGDEYWLIEIVKTLSHYSINLRVLCILDTSPLNTLFWIDRLDFYSKSLHSCFLNLSRSDVMRYTKVHGPKQRKKWWRLLSHTNGYESERACDMCHQENSAARQCSLCTTAFCRLCAAQSESRKYCCFCLSVFCKQCVPTWYYPVTEEQEFATLCVCTNARCRNLAEDIDIDGRCSVAADLY